MRDKTPKRQAEDLKDLVVAYVKQETLDPIKASGKHLGFGVAGALVLSLAVVFFAVGTLRMLQTETTWLDGPWSRLVTYLAVLIALGAGAALSWRTAQPPKSSAPGSATSRSRKPSEKSAKGKRR